MLNVQKPMRSVLTAATWLAVATAVRFEQTAWDGDAPGRQRLRAFDETGLRELMNGTRLPMTVPSFVESNSTDFPELPYFWRDRLRIVSKLGAGAFGEVYKCLLTCSDEPNTFVTLKHIKKFSKWTEREISYLQRMNQASDYCSSTIGSPSSFVTEEGTWILMPYLNHGDFLRLLRKCKGDCALCPGHPGLQCWEHVAGYSDAYVLALFYQLVRGVEALHASGIIHTDLKPENSMISCRDGKCFASVIDLGIACEPAIKGSCQKSGTPAYLAPEVWKDEKGALTDPKRDVWSLGVMLYLLMYEMPPPFFHDMTGQSTINYNPQNDPKLKAFSTKSKTLDILIQQMLEPDRRQRADIRGILVMLEQVIQDEYGRTDASPIQMEAESMVDDLPVDRHASTATPACLYSKVDYDVGDKPFEREFCVDQVAKAKGLLRCGFCVGCNPCCKCRVLRHGQKVKEYFRMQKCV